MLRTARTASCLAALLALGCADSTSFEQGDLSVWRLEDSGLVFGSFQTSPTSCEAARVGRCERVDTCEAAVTVAAAGTLTVLRGGTEVAQGEPNADGRYIIPLDEAGAPGALWNVAASGAEIAPFTLEAAMPEPVASLDVQRAGGAITATWSPPPGAGSVVVEVSSSTDVSFGVQCVLPPDAGAVQVDGSLIGSTTGLIVNVTAYAEDRAGQLVLRVGEPVSAPVP